MTPLPHVLGAAMPDDLDAPSPRMPGVRPDAVTCPVCGAIGSPLARIGIVAICGTCGASLAVPIDGVVRRAIASDLDVLQPKDRAVLVKARSAIVRPKP